MNIQLPTTIVAIAATVLLLDACKHDIIVPDPPDPVAQDPCSPDTVYFQDDILPLLVSNCAFSGCHDRGTATNGVILTNYSNIMNTADVEPGDPDGSELYERITDSDPNDRMPLAPNDPLSADQIALIRTWIEQGAQNNGCINDVPDSACPTANVTWSGTIQPIIVNKCQGCHSGTSPGGGVLLSTYDDVAVIAGDGRLNGVVNHLAGYKPMPLGGGMLPNCELDQIAIWLGAGFPNN